MSMEVLFMSSTVFELGKHLGRAFFVSKNTLARAIRSHITSGFIAGFATCFFFFHATYGSLFLVILSWLILVADFFERREKAKAEAEFNSF